MSAQTPPSLSLGQPMSPAVGIGMGVLSIVLGIMVLAWPGATLLVVAILFGIELVILGAIRIAVGAALPPGTGWVKPVAITLGVLTILAGLFCFFRPGASLVVLAIFLGIGWVIDGIANVIRTFGPDRSAAGRAFFLLSGIVSILAGLVVLIFPGSSLVTLTRIAGILLIIVGIAQLVSSFLARREGAAAPA